MGRRPSLSVKEFLAHPPPANFYSKNSQSSFESELFQNIKTFRSNIDSSSFERPEATKTNSGMIIFNPPLFLLNLFWYLKIIHQACLPRSGCSNDLVNPLPPRQLNISPFLPPIIYPVLPKLFTFSLPIITTFYEGNYLPCFTLSGLVSGYPWPWRHSKLKLNREWGRGRPGEVQYLFNC